MNIYDYLDLVDFEYKSVYRTQHMSIHYNGDMTFSISDDIEVGGPHTLETVLEFLLKTNKKEYNKVKNRYPEYFL